MTEDSDAIYRRCKAFMRDFHSLTDANPPIHGERIYSKAKAIAAIELRVFDRAIVLSSIRTFERRKGYGSMALDWLCTLADKHGVAITGTAQPYDSRIINDGKSGGEPKKSILEDAQLKAWYVRHGFKVSALIMRREPHKGRG